MAEVHSLFVPCVCTPVATRYMHVLTGVQYSPVYPATYDPARLGRINTRTELSNTTPKLVHWFVPISFGPDEQENRINEDRIKETIL
jgi:hypothetical protein